MGVRREGRREKIHPINILSTPKSYVYLVKELTTLENF